MKKIISFKGQIIKVAGSHAVIIPKPIMDSSVGLERYKKYDITISKE